MSNHEELLARLDGLGRYDNIFEGTEAAAAIRKLVAERDALRAALQRLYDADIAARDGNHGRRWQDALRAAEAALAGGRDE